MILAAVLPPTRDNAGFNLEELLADHRPVARYLMSGKLLDQPRQSVELVVLQASIDSIKSEQRHGSLFDRNIAGAFTQTEYCGVHHFDAFCERHDRVRYPHSE